MSSSSATSLFEQSKEYDNSQRTFQSSVLLTTTWPHFDLFTSFIPLCGTHSSSTWQSFRPCLTFVLFTELNESVIYLRIIVSLTDLNVLLIDGSTHTLVAVLYISITVFVIITPPTPFSSTVSHSQKQCLINSLPLWLIVLLYSLLLSCMCRGTFSCGILCTFLPAWNRIAQSIRRDVDCR